MNTGFAPVLSKSCILCEKNGGMRRRFGNTKNNGEN